MAKSNGKGFAGFGDLLFAAFSWNKELEAKYEEWIKSDAPDGIEAISYLVNAGYSIKFSPADDHGSYKVSATGVTKICPNENVCITSWGNDSEDGLLITLYKIAVVFDGRRAPISGVGSGGRR